MSAVGLPARIGYAVLAFAAGAAGGFYAGVFLLWRYAARLPGADPEPNGLGIFMTAVGAGAVLACTAALIALTLPWKRQRKRRGRMARAVAASICVLVVTLVFAGQGHALVYDLALPVWLTLTLMFTFVRYGVRDQARLKSRRPKRELSPYAGLR